jgi:hypothetical protein
MIITPGIKISGGLRINPIGPDLNLTFSPAATIFFQTKFTAPYTITNTFNADGSITSSRVTAPTRWYTGTPANAAQFEIAVLITNQSLIGSGPATFTVNGISQTLNVKSSYYPLTSGITIAQTQSSVTSGDEWFNEYTIFIKKIGQNEITLIGNQSSISP